MSAQQKQPPEEVGIPLRSSSLASIAAAGRVQVPGYDRPMLTPSIVHIGVGGFHRAHEAVYLDDLARQGVTEWGELGMGLLRGAGVRRSYDERMEAALKP